MTGQQLALTLPSALWCEQGDQLRVIRFIQKIEQLVNQLSAGVQSRFWGKAQGVSPSFLWIQLARHG
jgi:hypothetical protein